MHDSLHRSGFNLIFIGNTSSEPEDFLLKTHYCHQKFNHHSKLEHSVIKRRKKESGNFIMENTLALWQRSENFPAANFASNCPCCYLLQTCDYTHSSQTLTFDEKSFSFINIRSCRQRNMKKELFLAGLLWPFVAKKQKAILTQKVVFWKEPTLTAAVTKFK